MFLFEQIKAREQKNPFDSSNGLKYLLKIQQYTFTSQERKSENDYDVNLFFP